MKKSFILSTLMLLYAIPSFAAVDIHETTAPEYLYNNGYSSEAIRLIQYNKAYSNGIDFRAEEQNKIRNKNKFLKFMDYLDPSRDDNQFLLRDLRMQTPSYEDL